MYSNDSHFNHWSELVPDNTIEVIFSRNKISRKHALDQAEYFNGSSHVACLKTRLQHVKLHGETDLIGIRLHPAAWTMFCAQQPKTKLNSISDVSEFFGNRLEMAFIENLLYEPDIQCRFRSLETLLAALMCNEVEESLQVVYTAAELIRRSGGGIRIKDLASHCACSERTLMRYFTKHIGTTPKHYSRIIRIRAMLHYKLTHQQSSVSECAYKLGFYDLTHINKEIRSLGNLKPNELLHKHSADSANIQLYMLKKSIQAEGRTALL